MCERTYVKLFGVVMTLCLAGGTQAATVNWMGAGPDQLWSTPANWSTGAVPTAADLARIDHLPGPIIGDQSVVLQRIQIGSSLTGALTMNGGTLQVDLNVTLAAAVGGDGTLYMNDGVIQTPSFYVGYNGSGVVIVEGGTIDVANTLVVGRIAGTTGHVDLRGGTIAGKRLLMRQAADSVGTMDIGGGTLIVDGNDLSVIQEYIGNGWITAYDGRGGGALQLDYDITNKGKTTLKAIHSLKPNPPHGSSVPVTVKQLQWTLPEPNQPGGLVTCDVYFGTDPKVEANPKIAVGQAIGSAPVTLARDTVYYWALDVYDASVSDTEPVLLGPIFTFNTMNTPPVVYAGRDVITWLADGARTWNLKATVTDYGPCTVQWTVVSEPNDPNGPDAVIANPTAESTAIVVAAVGTYVVQVEAFDGEFTTSDTLTITVCSDSCQAAQSMPDYVPLVGDLNGDCKVDDTDLAMLQENWLKDNSMVDEGIEVE